MSKPMTMLVHSGSLIDLANLSVNDIKLSDIVWGLSHQIRYGGHSRYAYTVAMHSVMCLKAAQRYHNITDTSILSAILMHDAAEAYIGDLIRPIKHHIPDFHSLEEKIMTPIIEKFGLNPDMIVEGSKLHHTIKEIDYRICTSEMLILFPDCFDKFEKLANYRRDYPEYDSDLFETQDQINLVIYESNYKEQFRMACESLGLNLVD